MAEQLKANVSWIEVAGHFLCTCGESSYFNDCMLPATQVCGSCGSFYTIAFQVHKVKYPPIPRRCRMCGDEFLSTHLRGSKAGSYLQTCNSCRKGPLLKEVALKLGVSKQRVATKLKAWRRQNPEMKRAAVLKLMMERADGR